MPETPQFSRERLRALREGRGWSLRELARRTGLTAGFLSNLECGHAAPSVHTLERLSRAFGVPVSAFFEPPGEAAAPAVPLEEAIEELLSRTDVMFDGLPVAQLDQEVREDLKAAFLAILEYERKRRGRGPGGRPRGGEGGS